MEEADAPPENANSLVRFCTNREKALWFLVAFRTTAALPAPLGERRGQSLGELIKSALFPPANCLCNSFSPAPVALRT